MTLNLFFRRHGKMKVLFYIIWIVLIIVGSFTAPLIPETFRYLYGFLFGNASLVFLQLAKEIDD